MYIKTYEYVKVDLVEYYLNCVVCVTLNKESQAIMTTIVIRSQSVYLPFKSGYSGYSRVPGNFFDLPGNFRKIRLFQKILVVLNPKSQAHEPVEVESVYFPSKW